MYTAIPPPSMQSAVHKKRKNAIRLRNGQTGRGGLSKPTTTAPDYFAQPGHERRPAGPAPTTTSYREEGTALASSKYADDERPGPRVPISQLIRIYNYVMKRWSGQTPEQASTTVDEVPSSAMSTADMTGTIDDAGAVNTDDTTKAAGGIGGDQPPTQTGSGVGGGGDADMDSEPDDGSGVELTKDEMIRVPQGDRYKVFSHPSQILIAGATKSGKTTLLMNVLKLAGMMFEPVPEEVYWFYTMPSSVAHVPKALPSVRLRNGVPTEDMITSITKEGRPKLIVLDDMQDVLEDKKQTKMLMDVLTKVSHHGNLTIVFIVQNLYQPNMKKVRSQCDEIIVMGNGSAAMHNAEQLGRSLLAEKGASYLKECLSKARRLSNHSHLLVSSGAHTGPFNVRCGILPGDPAQAFFVQRNTVTTPEYARLKKHGEEGERMEEEEKRISRRERKAEKERSAVVIRQEGGRFHGAPQPILGPQNG